MIITQADLSVLRHCAGVHAGRFYVPLQQGVDFVLALYEQGGFEAIDQAYVTPPVSTEQILHPERYPDDKPVTVKLPDLTDTLGRTIRELDRGVMGEWYTYLILGFGVDADARLGFHVASEAANGWGGDAYAIYWDDQANKPIVVLYTNWDNSGEAGEFYNAFKNYGTLRWGDPSIPSGKADLTWETDDQGAVLFTISGDQTMWVIAPSMADAQTLQQTLSVGNLVGAR